MKVLAFIVSLGIAVSAAAQLPENKGAGIRFQPNMGVTSDGAVRVTYVDKKKATTDPAYYINGKLSNGTILQSLNPELIEKIDVVKGIFELNNVSYQGKIFITTKAGYQPKIVSLNALKKQYTNLNDKPALFIVNGNVVDVDYDDYLIDEQFVLNIIVEKIENKAEKLDLAVIKVLTKTPENIRKSQEIRIRGSEVSMRNNREATPGNVANSSQQ